MFASSVTFLLDIYSRKFLKEDFKKNGVMCTMFITFYYCFRLYKQDNPFI